MQFSSPASLDQPFGESEEATLLDLLDSVDSPDEYVESLEQREQVIALLESLNPRCRCVLEGRYGFEDEEEKTLAVIGAELNLSRERVRQIHDKALQSLSELIEAG